MTGRATTALLLGAVSLVVLGLAAAAPAELRPDAVPWTELQFRARKLGFSLTARMELGAPSSDAADKALVVPVEGTAVAPEASVRSIRLRSGFVGRNSEITVYFDPASGQAFQLEQLDSGKKNRFRVARFCAEGIDAQRREPAEGEAELPHADWSRSSHRWEAYPAWAGDDLLVSDPTALFYLAAAAPLEKPGDRYQVPVFTKGNLILVEMTVRAVERVQVDYTTGAGGASRVKGSVDALRISLDAQHLDPDSQESDLELMGLQGDVEMLVDRESRLPLELSGKVPIAGRVKVRLIEAKLR